MRGFANLYDQMAEVLDLILGGIAFYLVLSGYQQMAPVAEMWAAYLLAFFIYLLFWLIGARGFRLFQSRRTTTLGRELQQLGKSHFLALVISMIAISFYQPELLYNKFLYSFALLAVTLTGLMHISVRLSLQAWRRSGRNIRYVLLLGSGASAEKYLEMTTQKPQLGYKVIGYLADQRNSKFKISYLGEYAQLEAVLSLQIVDLTVIADSLSKQGIRESLQLLELMGKDVAIMFDDLTTRIKRSNSMNLAGLTMFSYDTRPRREWHELLKRLMDMALALVGLIVLSPLLAVLALIIKLTSPGPVIFSQERVGLNGRIFRMYKFRSMVSNAEELKGELAHLNEMSGPVFKITNDPRLTSIGKFIRKTSLDELPQLCNILRGDMSLVGPRPPLSSEVDLYDPQHRKRLSVKPGLTCIWQISGRNDVDFEEWMQMDSDYVDRWSLWLDMEILAKTVPVVLLRKGAS